MWLDELKIAVANNDAEAIAVLAGETPSKFDSLEDALQAQELLGTAINLIQKNRTELGKELEKLKNVKKYIAS
ncbi:hypothetical protein [Campylobacter showae]|uniref:hypothetical protein n=1 Tax=Campylobacter showae TaxID=204 RepID=UPI0028D1757C|nr:hypothetical protein [Campylobacter showae]